MSKRTQTYQEDQKKEAIQTLEELLKRVKRGQLEVVKCGYWEGMPGTHNYTVSVREPEES